MVTEKMKGPVLIVDDNEGWRKLLEKRLEGRGISALPFDAPSKAIDEIRNGIQYKMALVDIGFPSDRYDGSDVITISKRIHPEIPIVVISSYIDRCTGANVDYKRHDGIEGLVELIQSRLS